MGQQMAIPNNTETRKIISKVKKHLYNHSCHDGAAALATLLVAVLRLAEHNGSDLESIFATIVKSMAIELELMAPEGGTLQ